MQFAMTQDQMFEKLKNGESKSLLKKYLTPEIYNKYKDVKTPLGGALAHCINTGCEQLDSAVGIMAGDPDSYETYSGLFDPIIKDYHKLPMDKPIQHPAYNLGNPDKLPFGDLGDLVVSTRIRVGRSAKGFGNPPFITKEKRQELAAKAQEAFKSYTGELGGKYYDLESMTDAEKQQLIDDHFLFQADDRFNRSAGVYRDFPNARGIFHNATKTFLVWVNEEDHLRIISMQKGGNLGEVYARLIRGINATEKVLPFAYSKKLGYLTFCPTNLGTTLRASVHAKIPNLAEGNPQLFKETCDKYHIQARGIYGEHTASVGGVYDLSNKRRLGLTELDAVKEMSDGVTAILALEKKLTK